MLIILQIYSPAIIPFSLGLYSSRLAYKIIQYYRGLGVYHLVQSVTSSSKKLEAQAFHVELLRLGLAQSMFRSSVQKAWIFYELSDPYTNILMPSLINLFCKYFRNIVIFCTWRFIKNITHKSPANNLFHLDMENNTWLIIPWLGGTC